MVVRTTSTHYTHARADELKKRKREEAKERQIIRNKRTDAQQLDVVLNRQGNSTKEKTKLLRRLERRHDAIRD